MTWFEKNDGFHLDRIINTQECSKHKSLKTEPCWTIDSVHGSLRAICNTRALASGAQGKITPYTRASAQSQKKEHV